MLTLAPAPGAPLAIALSTFALVASEFLPVSLDRGGFQATFALSACLLLASSGMALLTGRAAAPPGPRKAPERCSPG